ncbi:MAG: hypothetical protein JO040_11030, partial [Gemmatimonadetes bacterium]|nr:hypothetical protein [Gemmatimonadota bacterium]
MSTSPTTPPVVPSGPPFRLRIERRREEGVARRGIFSRVLRYFRKLSSAERSLLNALPLGGTVRCTDPAGAGGEVLEGRLRAELLRWVCTDPEVCSRTDIRGIEVVNGTIAGVLDLSFCDVSFPILFRDCHFPDGIDLTSAKLCRLEIQGGSSGPIRASFVEVAYDLAIDGNFSVKGSTSFADANIHGSFGCRGGRFVNPQGVALDCSRIEVDGDVEFSDRFRALGTVHLAGAKLGSSLYCGGGRFLGRRRKSRPEAAADVQSTRALDAEGIEVRGDIYLDRVTGSLSSSRPFHGFGEVRLVGANVGDTIDCRDAVLRSRGRKALAMDRAKTGGTVFLADLRARGEVRLVGAVIGGNLECRGARILNGGIAVPEGSPGRRHGTDPRGDFALNADRVRVSGTVHLTHGFESHGQVRLVSAAITGSLVLTGATLRAGDDVALRADGATVGGNVYLNTNR